MAGSVAVQAALKRIPARLRAHNTTLVAAGVAFYAFLAPNGRELADELSSGS